MLSWVNTGCSQLILSPFLSRLLQCSAFSLILAVICLVLLISELVTFRLLIFYTIVFWCNFSPFQSKKKKNRFPNDQPYFSSYKVSSRSSFIVLTVSLTVLKFTIFLFFIFWLPFITHSPMFLLLFRYNFYSSLCYHAITSLVS